VGQFLKLSRPGLWFPTIWLYMLPLSGVEIFESLNFWLGLFYVTFPLNFMVYAWNDMYDVETDLNNVRKGNFLFGAKATSDQLKVVPKAILLVQVFTALPLVILTNFKLAWVFVALALVLALYNHPKVSLKDKAPFELTCQIGYLLIIPFSIILNGTIAIPGWTIFYLALFALQSHLMGEVMDIVPDSKVGKRTTAVVLGMYKTKLLIIAIVAAEVFVSAYIFQDVLFTGMLACGLIWLFIDLFLVFKTKAYSLQQMYLFGYASNAIAFSSMAYTWYSGCLLNY